MKTIPLTQGKVAFVSDKDYHWLSQWNWIAMWNGRHWYAVRRVGNSQKIYMHREIVGDNSTHVDHRDRNGLNNQRRNLRPSDASRNGANTKRQRNNSSGYKGVSWLPKVSRWWARIQVNNQFIHLGHHKSAVKAAKAYDKAAAKYFGSHARPNFHRVT